MALPRRIARDFVAGPPQAETKTKDSDNRAKDSMGVIKVHIGSLRTVLAAIMSRKN